MNFRLTNTLKHLGVMLAVGLAVWAFAYFGKAQGLGYFPNIAAFMITVWVEYRQWSRSGKPFMALLKQRGWTHLLTSWQAMLASMRCIGCWGH